MISFPFTYKKKDLKIDFNWNDSVKPCKEVKVSIGKKAVVLTRDEFSTLMAVFANDNQLEDIIQTTKEKFISIERMLRIKTNKDLKAGESLVFPYVYWIPETEYFRLKEEGEMVKLIEDSKKELIHYIAENEAGKEIKKMWATGKLKLEDKVT